MSGATTPASIPLPLRKRWRTERTKKRRHTREVNIRKSCSKLTLSSGQQAGGRERERVYFQELRRSTLEAATTRHSNRVTGVRRSNRRRGVALEEEEKEEEGYVEWVTKTLTTLLHKSPHRIPLKSLWRALNVGEGAPVGRQNLPLRSLWRPLNVDGGAYTTHKTIFHPSNAWPPQRSTMFHSCVVVLHP
jgi:hypothetical protein